jgi:hypothetical protein
MLFNIRQKQVCVPAQWADDYLTSICFCLVNVAMAVDGVARLAASRFLSFVSKMKCRFFIT